MSDNDGAKTTNPKAWCGTGAKRLSCQLRQLQLLGTRQRLIQKSILILNSFGPSEQGNCVLMWTGKQ
eukprot:2095569-Amphidinium_carterae.1